MSPRLEKAINWGLPLATLAVYAVMVGVYVRPLIDLAGGAQPFDLRIQGYDWSEARSYLRALPPEGYRIAENEIRFLDTVFPILFGVWMAWLMRPFKGVFGMVCVMAAMSYVALDLGENAFVGRLLHAGPDWAAAGDVIRASAMTQGKFVSLFLCLVLAIRQSLGRSRQS